MLSKDERLLNHFKSNNTMLVTRKPSDTEGANGDFAVGQTPKGVSFYAKIKNKWYEFSSDESLEIKNEYFKTTINIFHGTPYYIMGAADDADDGEFIPLSGNTTGAGGTITTGSSGTALTAYLPHRGRIMSIYIRGEIALGNVYFELFKQSGGGSLEVDDSNDNTGLYETSSTVSCTTANKMYTIPFSGNIFHDEGTEIALRYKGNDNANITYTLVLDLDIL